MLLNKVKDANKLIKLNTQSVELEKNNREFDRVQKRVKGIKDTIKIYTISMETLNEFNKDVFSKEELGKVINKLKKLNSNLADEYIDSSLIDAINKEVNEIETTLKEKWRNYYQNDTSSLRNTVVSIKNLVKDEQKAEIVINALSPQRVYWPLDKGKIAIIENNKKVGQDIINDLGLTGKITSFLSKISMNQATIYDLDDEILTWIKTKGLQNKIGLKFK